MLFPQARLEDIAEAQQSADLMNMLMQYGGLLRHPSQLYEFALEGIVLFGALWIYSAKPRATGKVSALFLIGYGLARFISEYFRNPDAGIFGKSDVISMGQWLSLPMIVIGIGLLVFFGRRKQG